MSQSLSILMAQINPTVGAINNNAAKIIDIIQEHQSKFDIIVFPELALTGYPPEDLLFRNDFFSQVEHALKNIQKITQECHVIVGHPVQDDKKLYNAASIICHQKSVALYYKQHLPNYGVFDEQRYFTSGKPNPCLITINNQQVGLCICEDIWLPGPADDLIQNGAQTIICINASPFDEGKYALRETLLKSYAQQGVTIIYVNQVGGQDELVFDGQSLVMDKQGKIRARSPAFEEHLLQVKIDTQNIQATITPLLTKTALLYKALICGLKDYVEKNKFPGVLLGLSGGVDSALTLAIAVDALGAARVQGVLMPSRYTANMSGEDAIKQAETLGVAHITLPIEDTFNTLLTTLAPAFNHHSPDTTEENIQARIRGVLLMALSNKTGNMLLSTSNKSETAVGYCTLYGDMAGGFAVLKDVLKTSVYNLAHYRNSLSAVIPERVLTRAPSAELAENQTDQDSLPDYTILDGIITAYMQDDPNPEEIIKQGYKKEDVLKIIKLIKRNEYKRRQAPPGVKVSIRAFGRDWRYPITSGY